MSIERIRIVSGEHIPGAKKEDQYLVTNKGPHVKAEQIVGEDYPMQVVHLIYLDKNGDQIDEAYITPEHRQGDRPERLILELPKGLASIEVEVI